MFKYRALNRIDPSQQILHGQAAIKQSIYDFVGVKYPPLYHETDEFFRTNKIERDWFRYPVVFENNMVYVHFECPPLTEAEEKMGGQLAWFKDCPYPYKGHPFPEAFPFVDTAKRFTRQMLELFLHKDMLVFFILFALLTTKRKVLLMERFSRAYVESCQKAMGPYILKPEYMNKYGREILSFVNKFLTKLGIDKDLAYATAECFASQIDWDNAYWMRVGDTMAETTKEKILTDPRRELKHLAEIVAKRNPTDPATGARLRKSIKGFSYLLLIPKYRRIFRECIKESEFENLQFDEADRYHTLLYSDYNYQGLTLAERVAKYNAYHTEHPPFPPRITIST